MVHFPASLIPYRNIRSGNNDWQFLKVLVFNSSEILKTSSELI